MLSPHSPLKPPEGPPERCSLLYARRTPPHYAVELMWHQDGQHPNRNIHDTHARLVLPPSSSKLSSSSSPFTFSNPTLLQTPGRTMEEVWKDIALSTAAAAPILDPGGAHRPYYHHQHGGDATYSSIADTNMSHLRGMILQDFLGRPFNGTSTSADSSVQAAPVAAAEERSRHHDGGALGAPRTALSLNSGVEFLNLDAVLPKPTPRSFPSAQDHSRGECPDPASHRRPSRSSVTSVSFSDVLGSPCPDIFSFCSSKKRVSEQQQLEGGASGDRRHKRMIKNRESAARSRARKQAYTNELELEVNHLTEENERLRRQHEELRAKLAAQLPKKKALQRSSTAPF